MIQLVKTLLVLTACCAALPLQAEFRIWEDLDGNVWEAEFVAMNGGLVVLRDQAGVKSSYSPEALCKDDLAYLEKVVPPRLSLDVSKITDSSASSSSSDSVQLAARIRQVDTRPYQGELIAVLSSIGEDIRTGAVVPVDTKEQVFTLPSNRGTPMEFRGGRASFAKNSSRVGRTYGGYVLVVWDRHGNVVAVDANRDSYLEKAESLAPLSIKERLANERKK